MARQSTGGVVEKQTTRGTSYGLRFRALGKRQFVHVGYSADGWSRKRAEAELQNVLADVRRGIWQPPAALAAAPEPRTMPTFHEFASEWFEAMKLEGGRKGKGLTPAGAADLEWRLTNHLLPAFAAKPLDQITVEDVDRYRRAKVAGGKLGTTSINKTLTTLAAILEVAVEYELISRNVAKGKRRRLPAVRPSRTWLDRGDHMEALLDGARQLDVKARANRGQRRAMVATLLFSGLRIGELLALRWADIDLARGEIRVRQGKTDASARKVTVLPALRDELLGYRARLRDVDRAAVVFATSTGGPWTATNVRRRVLAPAVALANEAMSELGEEPLAKLTPHSLRRTFASVLFVLDTPLPRAKRQMGHTTAQMTLDVYAQEIDPAEIARIRALVNGEEWASSGTSSVETVPTQEFVAAA